MSKRKKKWLLGIGVVLLLAAIGIFIAASILSKRFEPMIRQQAISYLSDRFNSDVQIASLRIRMPKLSVPQLILKRGNGVHVRVEGDDVSLRLHGPASPVPLFSMRKFVFDVDLGVLTQDRKTVNLVSIDGLRLNIPPKGDRPDFGDNSRPSSTQKVVIERVEVSDAVLSLYPKDPRKEPLIFDIARLNLSSAGIGVPMHYDATLTIPKPPGEVHSQGSFGPWVAREPGDTPLKGGYTFAKADLGVFTGIAGQLDSTGTFEGTLSSIRAQGEASVADFHLKSAGNAVPLYTRFDVLVDGTNGDTVLQPVSARLGSTVFTTSGAVIKREDAGKRSISLDVTMPDGRLPDLLRLAMKGEPFMEGRIALKTKIDIPPLTGTIKQKLRLDGSFQVRDGRFLRSNIQDQIDQLSRRGQGQPKNADIDEVVSLMRGRFLLDDQKLTSRSLTFGVPGADVDLAGDVDLANDELDLHGALKLRARVSQTMTGWKRWLLKPVDPFFAKNGAGTFLRIQVAGTSKQPKFGLDHGDKGDNEASRSR
jgi:hypothetical protein